MANGSDAITFVVGVRRCGGAVAPEEAPDTFAHGAAMAMSPDEVVEGVGHGTVDGGRALVRPVGGLVQTEHVRHLA
eukprot:CAMPEP_0175965634 /NCGR_PEP_ID=MMETSP0108-20121206/38219_1 /TAXON_ID=195067 ORGANISM="Goniomonas pacifica, Strain CCMP1869" /NCGR_SAMPLE_ID=MMETSP0108 /ASSEMBLY_ACC=CAM_ASM_000204 /LENGTH=75 /DNA_ID=CAMNT_0017293735 /DNA_START=133 /DNA_END=360 /DNA_ORIENTATION=+